MIHLSKVVLWTHLLQLNNQLVRQRVKAQHSARCTILQEAFVPCIVVRNVASKINLGSIRCFPVQQVNSLFLTVI